jgi:ATP-dependent Zn protease
MDNSQKEQDTIKQLNDNIGQLLTELNQEKALRKEVETQYEILSIHYIKAISHIKKNRVKVSPNDGACFFITILIIILTFLILFFFSHVFFFE